MAEINIAEAVTPAQLDQVAALLRDYLLWMRRRYLGHACLIDAYFDQGEWESELADLNGHYGAPFGGIVLARVDNVVAGCVMFRGVSENACEMKRLFVRPAFQRLGVARALVCKLADVALERGYMLMRLETGPRQCEAQKFYRSMGFHRIVPHHDADAVSKALLNFEAAIADIGCAGHRTREAA